LNTTILPIQSNHFVAYMVPEQFVRLAFEWPGYPVQLDSTCKIGRCQKDQSRISATSLFSLLHFRSGIYTSSYWSCTWIEGKASQYPSQLCAARIQDQDITTIQMY
jgi:hypothetical protein